MSYSHKERNFDPEIQYPEQPRIQRNKPENLLNIIIWITPNPLITRIDLVKLQTKIKTIDDADDKELLK